MSRISYQTPFIVLLLILAGCALAPPRPETPRQAVAVAEAQWTALQEAAADALEAGLVTGKEADELMGALRRIKQVRDQVWDLYTLPETNEATLAARLDLLTQLILSARARVPQ